MKSSLLLSNVGQDESGEWQYDYRLEEYGYVKNEQGEWIPPDHESEGYQENQQVPTQQQQQAADSIIQKEEQIAKPLADPYGNFLQNSESPTGGKDGNIAALSASNHQGPKSDSQASFFAKTSSDHTDQVTSSSALGPSSCLPTRPADYEDYWYQADDGLWYNEYDDLGYEFADEQVLLVEEHEKQLVASIQSVNIDKRPDHQKVGVKAERQKSTDGFSAVFGSEESLELPALKPTKQPRPDDFDDMWYENDSGEWRNKYTDMGYEFADDVDFYSDDEIKKEELNLIEQHHKAIEEEKVNQKEATLTLFDSPLDNFRYTYLTSLYNVTIF